MNDHTASDSSAIEHMNAVLARQKKAFQAQSPIRAQVRIDRLKRGIVAIDKYKHQLSEAMNNDFGCRATQMSLLADIAPALGSMKHAIKHLPGWMKTEKRKSSFPMNILGGRSRIEYQPLGSVGVISPWNFPVNLTFGPMADILAAGNSVMIKPSEFTPTVSEVMADIVKEAWSEEEVALFTGGPEVGSAFSALPFDHMLFTGATSVARHIMTAAAQNLVPVTLELGGKSPVIISRTADLVQTANRVMLGKTTNAGQICLAPDYLLVPEEKLDELIPELLKITRQMFPTIADNPEYTSIINERHYQRLSGVLEDAEQKGAKLFSTAIEGETLSEENRKIAPTLITNVNDDMRAMEEEIFGPLLPIKTYKDYEETINYINQKPRPLAVYYFGSDPKEERDLLDKTVSGGACINDVVLQITQENLPFGGVGAAGQGVYHGFDGFKNFSHAKSIYTQSKFDIPGLAGMRPPFNEKTEKTIKAQIKI